jgi:hypothetical protein
MTRATMVRWAVHVLLAGTCFGCGSGGAASGDGSAVDGPRLDLGTGRTAFEPLGSEGTVPLIKGLQGGYHVWTSLHAYGFETDVLRMDMTTRWGERDESLLEMKAVLGVKADTDLAGAPVLTTLGWPALVFDPHCANGKALDVDVRVTDTDSGRSASDKRRWILDVAEEDRSLDCPP